MDPNSRGAWAGVFRKGDPPANGQSWGKSPSPETAKNEENGKYQQGKDGSFMSITNRRSQGLAKNGLKGRNPITGVLGTDWRVPPESLSGRKLGCRKIQAIVEQKVQPKEGGRGKRIKHAGRAFKAIPVRLSPQKGLKGENQSSLKGAAKKELTSFGKTLRDIERYQIKQRRKVEIGGLKPSRQPGGLKDTTTREVKDPDPGLENVSLGEGTLSGYGESPSCQR